MVDVAFYVVYYYHKKGRESLSYQGEAKNEDEAKRYSAGVFTFLNDNIIFVDAYESAEVFWKDEKEDKKKYEEYLPLALEFKKEYYKKRNAQRLKRALERVKKEEKLISVKRDRKKFKVSENQLSLLD